MDNDSCVMNFIEIVPVDKDRNCSQSCDVELSSRHVKVSVLLYVLFLNSYLLSE